MSVSDLKDKTAVCGVGHSPYGKRLNRSTIDLGGEVIRNAMDDAGLSRKDLDGLIVSFGTPIGADADTLAYALGLKLRMYNQTWAHGRFTCQACNGRHSGECWPRELCSVSRFHQFFGLPQTDDGWRE
jgi:hypothetical protein